MNVGDFIKIFSNVPHRVGDSVAVHNDRGDRVGTARIEHDYSKDSKYQDIPLTGGREFNSGEGWWLARIFTIFGGDDE